VFYSLPNALVLIVDDASGDGAPELVRGHIHHGSRCFLLERSGNSGFASALCDGYRWALEGDVEAVVQMDADLSHDPDDLPILLDALESGACLAIGSRYCPGGGFLFEGMDRVAAT
jgi:dolichol-phosphate mannosyltransferase